MDEVGGLQFIGEPDEGEMEVWIGAPKQNVTVQPPSLADLSLRAVAIYGVFEMALGNRDQHLCDGVRHCPINHTERKCRERSVSARKERFDGLAAAQALAFRKGVNSVHLYGYFFLLASAM